MSDDAWAVGVALLSSLGIVREWGAMSKRLLADLRYMRKALLWPVAMV